MGNKKNDVLFGGSIPSNMASYPPPFAPYPMAYHSGGSSQFDASSYSTGVFPVQFQSKSELGLSAISLNKANGGLVSPRPRSITLEDYREVYLGGTPGTPGPSKRALYTTGGEFPINYSTQSLDRRLFLKQNKNKRANSLNAIHVAADKIGKQFEYGSFFQSRSIHGSASSMGAESDDVRKYRDIAL